MRKSCSLIKAIVLLLLAGVPALHAQDGLDDAFSRLDSACVLTGQFSGPSVATADFDNDTHPDGAVLFRSDTTFEFEVHFRSARVSKITFASRLPKLAISAFDINNDGNPDLVVEDPFSHQRLFVWLNDGYGSFHSAHAEDFPAPSDDRYRNLSSLSRTPQNQAAVGSAKFRLRIASSSLSWPPAPTDSFRLPRQATSPVLQFTPAPGLLRGPPFSISL